MKHFFLTIAEMWRCRKNHYVIEKAYLQLPKHKDGIPELMQKWFYNASTKEWTRDWKEATMVGILTGYLSVLILISKMKKQNDRMVEDLLKIDYSLVSVGDLLFVDDIWTSFDKNAVAEVKNWHKNNPQ